MSSLLPLVDLPNAVLVAIDIAAWGAFHAGTGYIAHRIDERRFDHDNWLTRVRSFERSGRVYRILRVQHWKDRLPEAGDLFAGGVSKRELPSGSTAGLEVFAALTRRAELAHWLCAAAGPLFVLWNPGWIGGVMVVYGLAVNAPFVLIQRYNRYRVARVLSRRSMRPSTGPRSFSSARRRNDLGTTGSNMPNGSPPNR